MITRRNLVLGGPAAIAAAAFPHTRSLIAEPDHLDLNSSLQPAAMARPLLKDIMGLNGHTVMFRPALYRPVCRLVRDYHNLDWDIGTDTDYVPRFPMSRNQVNWQELYGRWNKEGFEIDVCVQFGAVKADKWKQMPTDAYDYGIAFAKYFGPSGLQRLAGSVEIGNEPGDYPDKDYRTVFENMAKGFRQGDPRLKIVTCAAVPGKSEPYAKSLSCVEGLEPLYDVINVHTYAFAEQYPTWRRSYPEDPKIRYLQDVNDTISWRNAHAPGKQIWITEFGWDASTKPPPKTGDFSRWMSSTETQQAQYLVRSFFVFSAMDVDRAYIYFFDDNDEPQLHGSSGITRKFIPKPAYYAVAHLYRTLGDYRFVRPIVKDVDKLYVYEYKSSAGERIWAVWSPTGSNSEVIVALPDTGGKVSRAERMPLKDRPVEPLKLETGADGKIRLTVTESPAYLWIK